MERQNKWKDSYTSLSTSDKESRSLTETVRQGEANSKQRSWAQSEGGLRDTRNGDSTERHFQETGGMGWGLWHALSMRGRVRERDRETEREKQSVREQEPVWD
jgi:hypothetical protein